MDNAERVLEAVWNYCVPREISFKFLRSQGALLGRVSKYAARGFSGKLVTIYPPDDWADRHPGRSREPARALGAVPQAHIHPLS